VPSLAKAPAQVDVGQWGLPQVNSTPRSPVRIRQGHGVHGTNIAPMYRLVVGGSGAALAHITATGAIGMLVALIITVAYFYFTRNRRR
jgi:hypothetical protein